MPTVSNLQSLNRFSYVRNNPVGRIDPSGHVDCGMLDNSYDAVQCWDGKRAKSSPAVPDVPSGSMVDFEGFDESNEYHQRLMAGILEAAMLVGTMLAAVLNGLYGWSLTPEEAFLLVYGGTVTFTWTGEEQNYAAFTESANSILVYDTTNTVGTVTNVAHWAIHELGHAFSQRLGGAPSTATDTFLNSDATDMLGRPEIGLLEGLNYGYAGNLEGSLLWQQSDDWSGSEQFADMFLGYTYGTFDSTTQGQQMANFMSGNMPLWVDMAINK